jgi:hypothetical protein
MIRNNSAFVLNVWNIFLYGAFYAALACILIPKPTVDNTTQSIKQTSNEITVTYTCNVGYEFSAGLTTRSSKCNGTSWTPVEGNCSMVIHVIKFFFKPAAIAIHILNFMTGKNRFDIILWVSCNIIWWKPVNDQPHNRNVVFITLYFSSCGIKCWCEKWHSDAG